jgi:Zn-dependent peptidase ImmA (M78 family)/transcriptional regulator with XRE-family HTH domain
MSWLGQKLKELLDERGLSIQRVATDLGIERPYISMIIHSGRIPSEELTRKLAVYFGEDPEEWAFKTKAEPVMEEFRRRYPNQMPKYARNVTDDGDQRPKHNFSSADYLNYNAPSHSSEGSVTEFLPIKLIERYASEALRLFADSCQVDIEDLEFPLDAELLVRKVFQLKVHYDAEGVLDQMDSTLLGCLYADGMPSPWGIDRLIVVNASRRFQSVTDNFTILHEGGHYVFHHPLDVQSFPNEGKYCRNEDVAAKSRVHPREWQASRFASEVLMPKAKVSWLLDGKAPPEVINLDIYGPQFREYFGVSQAAMEKRLYDLGFKCAFGRYAYANVTAIEGKFR